VPALDPADADRVQVLAQVPRPGVAVNQKPEYVYVASSWRNPLHVAVCAGLRQINIPHYDFKNPEGGTGFHWSDVGLLRETCPCNHLRGAHGFCAKHGEAPKWDGTCNCPKLETVDAAEYLKAIEHPTAVAGYDSDFAAMQKADAFVLVLPCGRSAHLELGWAVGQGKRTAILLDDPCTPELMYRMVDYIAPTFMDLLGKASEVQWMPMGRLDSLPLFAPLRSWVSGELR
jgi:hypothetical protein